MLPRGLFLILCLCLTLVSQSAGAVELTAGCSRVDISPRVVPAIRNGGFLEASAEHIEDPLHARCLALSDGHQTLLLAIVDSCMVPRDVCDEIKREVYATTGLRTANMLIAATHTHSAPSLMDYCLGSRADPNYRPWFVEQVSKGMRAAFDNRQPARIGWTVVDAPDHTFCRRWLKHPDHIADDPFGAKTVRAMMHPGYQNPEYLGPAGPVDSQLSLLSVQTVEGTPLCVLANYSMHYFGANAFSADYFGDFARLLEARMEASHAALAPGSFLAIMSQGTSGDQHWMNYARPARVGYSRQQYAAEIVELAWRVLQDLEYRTDPKLFAATAELSLKLRVPDEARLAWARPINAARGSERPRNLAEVYAEQAEWLAAHGDTTLLLQAMRIGDLGIAAIPNEVFGITGLKLKGQSPLQPLFNLELANGAEGYIPPPEQHALGGYTTWPARTAGLEIQAEPKIVEQLLQLLESLSGQPRKSLDLNLYDRQQNSAIQATGFSR